MYPVSIMKHGPARRQRRRLTASKRLRAAVIGEKFFCYMALSVFKVCSSSGAGVVISLKAQETREAQSAWAQPICMWGAFPPPVHGMAWLNYAMGEYLRSIGMQVHIVDLSASSLDRRWFSRA